jgi:hypothetical protein
MNSKDTAMTFHPHPRLFGDRIVAGVTVATVMLVLGVIIAAADHTLVSPAPAEIRGAPAHAQQASSAPAATDYFPARFAAPTGEAAAHVEAF